MTTGLTLSNMMYELLRGIMTGAGALMQTGQAEQRQLNKRSLLALYKECVALETALTSTAYLTHEVMEAHMGHISNHIAKFSRISQSLGNLEKLAILQADSFELNAAVSTIEDIHSRVSTEDSIDHYKAHFSELQNFFQSLANVLELIISY